MTKKIIDPIHTIGKLLEGPAEKDAIHIAILPVICTDDYTSPGAHVKIKYGTINEVKEVPERISMGIIDPFIGTLIKKGNRCFMFLKPGTITGLRHEWVHANIADKPFVAKNPSEHWLREFADKWNFDYNELIKAASNKPTGKFKNYVTAEGEDLHSAKQLGADHDLFWMHLGLLTNERFDEEHKTQFVWSCSC